jgi:serine/threonine protein kinase
MIVMSDHPPIPGYELLRLRGRNGHLVYLARQLSSGRLVHLNVVHSSGEFGQMVADGLRQHAALLATLDHPNILRCVEVGDAQDYGFFSALEHAEGGDLADKIRAGPLLSTEAVSIARAIADASHYARTRNVGQAGLCPGSVLLAKHNVPKLTDFRLTSAGLGSPIYRYLPSPNYGAPEEFSDSEEAALAPATDVYRVGAVLYAMLTGRPPFSFARDLIETIRRVRENSPAAVCQWNPAVPSDLEAICMKCLEKQPAMRYAEAGHLVHQFDAFLAGGQARV